MIIHQSEVIKYQNYLLRFLKINIGHILLLPFTFILLSIASITLAIVMCAPFLLYCFVRVYYPNSKSLIGKIEFKHERIHLEYYEFSQLKKLDTHIDNFDVTLKFPFGAIRGTPYGLPVLAIKCNELAIQQFSLIHYLDIWAPSEIQRTYLKIKELKKIPPTPKEEKILKRLNWAGNID